MGSNESPSFDSAHILDVFVAEIAFESALFVRDNVKIEKGVKR